VLRVCVCGARCAVARPTRLQTVYARRRRLRLRLRLRRRDDDLACPSPPRASHGRSRRSVVLVCPPVTAVRSRAISRFSANFRLRHCHSFRFFFLFISHSSIPVRPSSSVCVLGAFARVFASFFVSDTNNTKYLYQGIYRVHVVRRRSRQAFVIAAVDNIIRSCRPITLVHTVCLNKNPTGLAIGSV